MQRVYIEVPTLRSCVMVSLPYLFHLGSSFLVEFLLSKSVALKRPMVHGSNTLLSKWHLQETCLLS